MTTLDRRYRAVGGLGAFVLAAAMLLSNGLAHAQGAGASATTPKLKGIWEPVNYGEDLRLVDVFFVTPEIGYVSGAAGTILKTTDAGASWTAQLGGDPQSEEREIQQLWFVTPTAGWAAQTTSSQTNLFRTTDGESWTRIGVIDEHYEDFAFTSESEGVYIDDEKVYRTRDGGKSWSEVYSCATKAEVGGLTRQITCQFSKLRFASPSVGYALGRGLGVDVAVVAKSEDGGASWSAVTTLENENGWEGGLFFLDEKTGYLATKDAKSAYHTADGGLTWTAMPATAIPRYIAFADPGVGWAMRYNKLSYTTDGGKRWASRTIAFPAMANAFSLPRRDRAYAVGDHGMIYRYSVVPEATAVPAKVVAAPAMPALDNAVVAQIAQLDARLGKLDAAVGAAVGGGGGVNAAFGGELAQLQSTVDAIVSDAPAMGRKHRNLNLVIFGLELLGDLTGQSSGLKEAFASMRQAKDMNAVSSALKGLHGQLDAMKTSVETFKAARRSGS